MISFGTKHHGSEVPVIFLFFNLNSLKDTETIFPSSVEEKDSKMKNSSLTFRHT